MYEFPPSVHDVVMVKIRSITDLGAHADLLGYSMSGLINSSEVYDRRHRRLIRVNEEVPANVSQIDGANVDLSLRISEKEKQEAKAKWKQTKTFHSLMKQFRLPIEELYSTFGFPLYRKYGYYPETFTDEDLKLRPDLIFPKKKCTVSAKLHVSSLRGIDAIKDAFRDIDGVRVIAPPLYSIELLTDDRETGIAELKEMISRIAVVDGECKVIEGPV